MNANESLAKEMDIGSEQLLAVRINATSEGYKLGLVLDTKKLSGPEMLVDVLCSIIDGFSHTVAVNMDVKGMNSAQVKEATKREIMGLFIYRMAMGGSGGSYSEATE